MARKTGKPKPKEIESILQWAEEAIADRREARIWADDAVAYAERALRFPPRERDAILLTKEARLALIECEGVEEVVESVGRAARDALDHARRAKEAVTRARRR